MTTLDADLIDLLAAIRDLLDLPIPAITASDEQAHEQLLAQRTGHLIVKLNITLARGPVDLAQLAHDLRAYAAKTPPVYARWTRPTNGGEAR